MLLQLGRLSAMDRCRPTMAPIAWLLQQSNCCTLAMLDHQTQMQGMHLLHQSPCDSLTHLCSTELLLQLPNLLIRVTALGHRPLHLMLGSLILQSSHLQAAPKLPVSTLKG